ncbi:hypothetical protein BY996DRAFT_6900089 [Phakopsora pachyrhizi]|nr:hypothetical protein BY996DRAFT_6900089 [Phakopsora pachyrhizi]
MAFQDVSAAFPTTDIPTSTARLLQAIIQPLPSGALDGKRDAQPLAPEQATAIVRALFIASLDQFFDTDKWNGLELACANKEKEMCEAAQGVLDCALNGEIARSPGFLVKRFPEQKTLEDLFRRAQASHSQVTIKEKNQNYCPELEEELSIWLMVRLFYTAALIRSAPNDGLSSERLRNRFEFVHQMEAASRLVHSFLFRSVDKELREDKAGRACDISKLWITLEEEARAILMCAGEETGIGSTAQEAKYIQLLGIDRRTQIPLSESHVPLLQLDRRPFIILISSQAQAVNFLLTTLRIHVCIFHLSPYFISGIPSATEALITLWELTMRLYPTRHDKRVMDDLFELLSWFFEGEVFGPGEISSPDLRANVGHVGKNCKSINSTCLDKLCSIVIEQTKKIIPKLERNPEPYPEGRAKLVMLMMKVLCWLADQDGETSTTRTVQSLNHFVVRFGRLVVEYVTTSQGVEILDDYGLLCLSFLLCPRDIKTGRVRYLHKPEKTFLAYRLTEKPIINQFELFIPQLIKKFQESNDSLPHEGEKSRIRHWLRDTLSSISSSLQSQMIIKPSRKRKLVDLLDESKTFEAFKAHQGNSSAPTLPCENKGKNDAKETDLSWDSSNAVVLSLLNFCTSKGNFPNFETENMDREMYCFIEQIKFLITPAPLTEGSGIKTIDWERLEQTLDILGLAFCNSSKSRSDFLTSTDSNVIFNLPSKDLETISECPHCNTSGINSPTKDQESPRKIPATIFQNCLALFRGLGLLLNCTYKDFKADSNDSSIAKTGARLALLRFLTRLINHTKFETSETGLNLIDFELISSSLTILEHGSHIERIVAGRLVVSLFSVASIILKLFPAKQLSDCKLESAISKLESLAKVGELKVQETLLITILSCFEATRHNDQLLMDNGKVELKACFSYCLISMTLWQMCKRNSYLLGVIRNEMLSLARRNSVSVYNIMARYLPAISQLIVVELKFDSYGSSLLSDLLGMSTNVFLNQTARYTLPALVMKSQRTIIQKIAVSKEETVPEVLISHAADIITSICLQKGIRELNHGLSSFYHLLNDGRKGEDGEQLKIEINALFQVSAGLIYFRLIVEVVEDIDTGKRLNSVKSALWKAFQLKQPRPDWSKPLNENELRLELKSQTLPILSHMNGSLQDLRGKISIAEKIKVIQGLGDLIFLADAGVSGYIPQIMTTLQASLAIPALRTSTLQTWELFVKVIPLKDLKAFVGQITATLVDSWSQMSAKQMSISLKTLHRIVMKRQVLGSYAYEIADLSNLTFPQVKSESSSNDEKLLKNIKQEQEAARASTTFISELTNLVGRINSESEVVVRQALKELVKVLETQFDKIKMLISGDSFDPLIGHLIKALIGVSTRCNDASDDLKSLAFQCLGSIGAVDPDRCEIEDESVEMVLTSNFDDVEESINFVVQLIKDQLVGAYRSTHDSKHHNFLTYAIQELLRFCGFTEDLLKPEKARCLPSSTRTRWNLLPKSVSDSISPLLGSKFKFSFGNVRPCNVPIYNHTSIYSSWLQHWLLRMIPLVENPTASKVFYPFLGVVRNGDTVIAQKLLPHVALHLVISGSKEELENIKLEIVTVLEDQVKRSSSFSPEGRQLVAQTIFGLMDHFSRWVRDRLKGQASIGQVSASKRREGAPKPDAATLRAQSVVTDISQELIASAALYCKDHARALLNVEQQVLKLEESKSSAGLTVINDQAHLPSADEQLQKYYEKAHEIYAAIDDPDGMEGISTKIVEPSILHQIREHESTGRWTSAQSCWEVELQRQPDELQSHMGLLRCLRNLGHYDSLRAHLAGVLQNHHSWERELAPFAVESSLVSNDWEALSRAVRIGSPDSLEVIFGKVVDVLLNSDKMAFDKAMMDARIRLGSQILGASRKEAYRRVYDSAIYLHILHEVPIIDQAFQNLFTSVAEQPEQNQLNSSRDLMNCLQSRLDSISPAFRHREKVLRLRRATFQLRTRGTPLVGQLWVQTAKIARIAGHLQSSYSAVLQASEMKAPTAFVQKAKLMKLEDQPYKAIMELENNLRKTPSSDNFSGQLKDISAHEYAKAALKRVRWMVEVDRYSVNTVVADFEKLCIENPNWASPYYYFGRFYDEKGSRLTPSTRSSLNKIHLTIAEYTYHCCKNFQRSLAHGTKFIYQGSTSNAYFIFHFGQDIRQDDYTRALQDDELGAVFLKVDRSMHSAVRKLPIFEWLTVLPQVVSRVMHKSTHVQAIVHKILTHTLRSYPDQALWAMVSGVESSNSARSSRCTWVLNDAKNYLNAGNTSETSSQVDPHRLSLKIEQCRKLVRQLLRLCNHPVKNNVKCLSLHETFPALQDCAPCELIIPLQSSLIASLPPHEINFALHKPFPTNLPCIQGFDDKISIMPSLQKPRKICLFGSDGKEYPFLCKPKDDLRKDARLMEFNSMINKLLKKDSESRKRNLRIRTYAVVVLNEECGLLEWVSNTIPFRNILLSLYSLRGIQLYNAELKAISDKIRRNKDDLDKVKQIFEKEILSRFPPVFHQWFLNNFADPNSWLRSRQAYGRTTAVISMVGFVLGLGDRHGENILFDSNTGETVHVDFNCLFDKGRTFEVSENVPFRLTQNMVAGLGITGVEGVFRRASEVTMKILRNNKDSLMSVLETFVHDPLVDWMPSGSKKKVDAPTEEYIAKEAKRALEPISRKLTGYQITFGKTERQMSTENQVDSLINEARDNRHLVSDALLAFK